MDGQHLPNGLSQAREEFHKLLNRTKEDASGQRQNIKNYPNVVCVTCMKWVCSRNRVQHMEAHLQYKPYKCPKCPYGARREIFVKCHMKEFHPEEPIDIIYRIDPQMEKRAKDMASTTLAFTNFIKTQLGKLDDENVEPSKSQTISSKKTSAMKRVLQESTATLNPDSTAKQNTFIENRNQAAEDFYSMIKRDKQTIVINVSANEEYVDDKQWINK